MKSAVLVFPGSNCDRDLAVALERATGRKPEMVWHRETSLPAGLDLIAYEETPDWRRRQAEINRLLLEAAEDLAAESGEPVEEVRSGIIEMAATNEVMTRRVLVVAQKP